MGAAGTWGLEFPILMTGTSSHADFSEKVMSLKSLVQSSRLILSFYCFLKQSFGPPKVGARKILNFGIGNCVVMACP